MEYKYKVVQKNSCMFEFSLPTCPLTLAANAQPIRLNGTFLTKLSRNFFAQHCKYTGMVKKAQALGCPIPRLATGEFTQPWPHPWAYPWAYRLPMPN